MDIDTARFLLSALIQSLATVLALGFIALSIFPRSAQAHWVSSTKWYDIFLALVIIMIMLITASILANIYALAHLDPFGDNRWVIYGYAFSVISFVFLAFVLTSYLFITRRIEYKK